MGEGRREEGKYIIIYLFKINIKGEMELKMAAMILIIESGKTQQMVLKLIGKILLRNMISP